MDTKTYRKRAGEQLEKLWAESDQCEAEWQSSFGRQVEKQIRALIDVGNKDQKVRLSSSTMQHMMYDHEKRCRTIIHLGDITSIYGLPVIIDDSVPYGEAAVE